MKSVRSRDGTTIGYDEKGDGPALILVDGALTTRVTGSKAELVDLLAARFTVFSHDRRGRGDSGDTLPYAVEREIEDIDALIDQARTPAFLYGHSSGGCLTLETARILGAKVTKVGIYEAPYNDDPSVQEAWAEYLRQLTEALAADRRGDAVALFAEFFAVEVEPDGGEVLA